MKNLNDLEMGERIEFDDLFLSIAKLVANRSTCKRARVGAVLLRDNRIISTGFVGAPPGLPHCTEVGCSIGHNNGCERTIHAEQNAIAFAARYGVRTNGAVMACTHSPCMSCAKLMLSAGIVRLKFLFYYRDEGALDLLLQGGCMWEVHPDPTNLYV